MFNRFRFGLLTMNLKPPCEACLARENHIDDLRSLLESERAQRTSLINILLGRSSPQISQGDETSIIGGTSPSISSLRRRQANREVEQKGSEQFWEKRREHYARMEKEIQERIAGRVGYKETKPVDDNSSHPEESDNIKSDQEVLRDEDSAR